MMEVTPSPSARYFAEGASVSPRSMAVRLSDVQPHQVRWLWPGRLPLGKLAVLEGDPGSGKSTITLDLAARITTGRPMPGEAIDHDHRGHHDRGHHDHDHHDHDHDPRGVLLLSAEDDLASTIQPRLEAAGADLDRVVTITGIPEGVGERPVSLPSDLRTVEEAIIEHDVVLLIIDPFSAFLDPTVDALRDQAVRRTMHALAAVAERTGATILAIRHLTKAAGARAMYRGGGSVSIIAAARVGLLVAPDPEDPSRRLLSVVKSNLGAIPPTMAYRLVPHDTGVATVLWDGEVDAVVHPVVRDSAPKLTSAEKMLQELLADGPRSRRDIQASARAQGLGWRTVETAKGTLGVTDYQEPIPGRRGPGPSYWALPTPTGNEMEMGGLECDRNGSQG